MIQQVERVGVVYQSGVLTDSCILFAPELVSQVLSSLCCGVNGLVLVSCHWWLVVSAGGFRFNGFAVACSGEWAEVVYQVVGNFAGGVLLVVGFAEVVGSEVAE